MRGGAIPSIFRRIFLYPDRSPPLLSNAIKLRKSLATQRLASPFGESAEGNGGMLAVSRAMLNSPMLSIFQNFHAIPLRSPLISLRSKWRLTGFSRRFTPKNPVRLHNPIGELPRWGAKNVLPLNLIALPMRGRLFNFSPSRHPERSITVYVK